MTRGERGPMPHLEFEDALEAHDAGRTGSAAAAVLEYIADGLSWTRGMSVVRRRGDGSLGDRWPSIAHALRKTDADDIAEQISRSAAFRRLVEHDAPVA